MDEIDDNEERNDHELERVIGNEHGNDAISMLDDRDDNEDEVRDIVVRGDEDIGTEERNGDDDDREAEMVEEEENQNEINDDDHAENIQEMDTDMDRDESDERDNDEGAEDAQMGNTVEDMMDVAEDEEEEEETELRTTSGGMRLKPRQRVDYKAFHTKGARMLAQKVKKIKGKIKRRFKIKVKDMFRKVMAITMAQISAASKHDQVSVEEGIRRYGNKAVEAVLSEYSQLNDKSVFRSRMASELTVRQKKDALNLITMVKEKRCGKIKGRACADGRKQRRYIGKEESSSPTIHLESLLLSLLFDAFGGRHVATADIAGAFLLAEMKDFVLVKIRGEAVDILCRCNAEYEKHVTYEKGKKVLYLELVKALYGCIMSALLWYETFVTQLEVMGFELNPYDPCVANKVINGSQCTVCWYVDDTKISHKDKKVVQDIINTIEKRFGKMTVKEGNKHTFVGMDFEFIGDGKVQISMIEYLRECIETFEEEDSEISKKCATPGKHDLFKVDNDSPKLTEERAEKFHNIVAKLLYVSKRARLDIDLAVSFLCTRVAEPTEQDWGNYIGYWDILKGY